MDGAGTENGHPVLIENVRVNGLAGETIDGLLALNEQLVVHVLGGVMPVEYGLEAQACARWAGVSACWTNRKKACKKRKR